jgi:glucokinase
MPSYAIGLDLGGTNLKAGLVHREDGLVEVARRPTEAENGPDHVLDQMAAVASELMEPLSEETVLGIGVGSPGAINWDRTTVSHPPNLPGWTTVNLREALRTRLGALEVVLDNDANVAALGSAYYGAGTAFDSFLMVTLGTGVGGAIIYRNQIFRGSTGGAGEIGHMTIDYEGPYANTGVGGAIEGYLGQSFLSDHARDRLVNYPESAVYDLVEGNLDQVTPRVLYEAAQQDDEAARDILAWAGHKLGCVLGAAVNLLDIRTIIVGGGVSAAGRFILDPARDTLPRYVTPSLRDDLTIRREKRGNDVGMLGAARLVFEGADAHV